MSLWESLGYRHQQLLVDAGQHIALVPGMVGWPTAKVRDRVEEMLDLVGLDPGEFRDRHPRQLSGGQQQRVGVARALAADPPVLLMDEPFGAVDPITREHLQNELIRLQRDLHKTIVFVTHDFDEAIKLGDRIAVLREQSHIAQFDAPEAILTNPADDYVSVKQYPAIARVLAPISRKLTTKTAQRLNAKVDVDGQDPHQVALDWMVKEGFIKES